MLKLNTERTKDFGISKEKIIRVHFQEYENLGHGEDRAYVMEFTSEEDMSDEIEHMRSNTFITKIEECVVYKQNKRCMYCSYYDHQTCRLKDIDVDCLDNSCDSFE